MRILFGLILVFTSSASALPRWCWPFGASSVEEYQVRDPENLQSKCRREGDLEGTILYRFLSGEVKAKWDWQFKQGKLRVSFEPNLSEHNPLPLAVGSFLAYLSEGRIFLLRGIPGEGIFNPKLRLPLGEMMPQYRIALRVRPIEAMEALPKRNLVSLATINVTESPLHVETVHLFDDPHEMLKHVERLDMLAVRSDIAWIELKWRESRLRELHKRVRQAFKI